MIKYVVFDYSAVRLGNITFASPESTRVDFTSRTDQTVYLLWRGIYSHMYIFVVEKTIREVGSVRGIPHSGIFLLMLFPTNRDYISANANRDYISANA